MSSLLGRPRSLYCEGEVEEEPNTFFAKFRNQSRTEIEAKTQKLKNCEGSRQRIFIIKMMFT